MSWISALKIATTEDLEPRVGPVATKRVNRPQFEVKEIDWANLVVLDFETYYDQDYTLSKLSTSEYIRDPRFKAQMVGIKIGAGPTQVIPHEEIADYLAAFDWGDYDLLCHNTAFDGFILSHHYGVHPRYVFDTLSMARGLHSNDIGGSLEDVAVHYAKGNKLAGVLESTKGIVDWDDELYEAAAKYCKQDVELTLAIFKEMVKKMPASEMDLIDLTIRMFTRPVLKVDIPAVEAELQRELDERKDTFDRVYSLEDHTKTVKLTGKEKALPDDERKTLIVKRVIGSNEKFAALLTKAGVHPDHIPTKISPVWIKKKAAHLLPADAEVEYVYAFGKDDLDFKNLIEDEWRWTQDLNREDVSDMKLRMPVRRAVLETLIAARLAVKSTTNITRAERFLTAGAHGMSLPVGYAYFRAHTGRWGGNNKMNMQNLKRKGALRKAILAPKGHVIAVADSGQIEARVNGWLWGQKDLLDGFRQADKWNKKTMGVATGDNRDAYCKFADNIYGREITTNDELERFVGKVCLGPDTLVLTNHGLKSIIEVRSTDLLWDGTEWVQHKGLVDQGKKTTLTWQGLSATPDHEILTERGWLEWQEVLTDPSLIQSALSSANLPSCAGNITSHATASLGGIVPSADVLADQNPWSTSAALNPAAQHDATHAQRSRQAQNGTGFTKTLFKMMSTVRAYLTAYHRQSAGAVTRTILRTSTMASAASQFTPAGSPTVQSSFAPYRLSPAGTSLNLNLTGSTTTAVIAQATSGSLQGLSTPETSGASKILSSASEISKQTMQTYDLADAGPNHRFTVMTDAGPLIVHNCVLGLGFQMGAAKFQMTMAKGALGGPPVIFSLNECYKIVNTYRGINSAIVYGWEICEQIIKDMAHGQPGSFGPLAWEQDKLWLPNGLCMHYPNLKEAINDQGRSEWSYRVRTGRTKIYGGLLCENIVQALARIIVAEQILEISQRMRVVMITHDEIVTCVKEKNADLAFSLMEQAMRRAPAWCSDIPLNCEGGYAHNYSK